MPRKRKAEKPLTPAQQARYDKLQDKLKNPGLGFGAADYPTEPRRPVGVPLRGLTEELDRLSKEGGVVLLKSDVQQMAAVLRSLADRLEGK